MCWWRCLCGRKKRWGCLGGLKTSGLVLQLCGTTVCAVYPGLFCLPAPKPLCSSGCTVFTHPQVLFLVHKKIFSFHDISPFYFCIHPFPCLHSFIRFLPSPVSSWESLMVIDFNINPNILAFAQCFFFSFFCLDSSALQFCSCNPNNDLAHLFFCYRTESNKVMQSWSTKSICFERASEQEGAQGLFFVQGTSLAALMYHTSHYILNCFICIAIKLLKMKHFQHSALQMSGPFTIQCLFCMKQTLL